MREFKGIKPFSFQQDVIDEVKDAHGSGKVVVVKSRRQVGKSILISNLLLYYAINISGTKNYCVSPTYNQGKKIYKSIVSATVSSGIIKSRNATELIITLTNGSSIIFKSAEQRDNLRGETCTGLLCIDECSYISDDIYNIIKPWCDFHKAVTLMVSTPLVKSGFFYLYYNYGLEKIHNTVSIDWCDQKYKTDLDIILPPERLEEYRSILPRNVFKTEYLGEFLDDDGTVFVGYQKCVKNKALEEKDFLYIGLDWCSGGEGDYTVLSAINQLGEQVYMDRFNRISTTEQINKLSTFINSHKKQIRVIQSETNSIGTPLTDLLKEKVSPELKEKFVDFNTSNQSKNALVTNLQVAFEQKQIKILNNDIQLRELSYYTAEFNPKTRNITYNAPSGLHDDTVMALMLSYDAYKNHSTPGTYNLVFTNKRKIN